MSSKEEYFIEEVSDEVIDFKGILLRLFNYWPYFLVSVVIAITIAFVK